jgi:hypothetical protein
MRPPPPTHIGNAFTHTSPLCAGPRAPAHPHAPPLCQPSQPPSFRSICDITVVDGSKYTVPPKPGNSTCFYRDTKVKLIAGGLICIPTSELATGATTAGGKSCSGGKSQFLAAASCSPNKCK